MRQLKSQGVMAKEVTRLRKSHRATFVEPFTVIRNFPSDDSGGSATPNWQPIPGQVNLMGYLNKHAVAGEVVIADQVNNTDAFTLQCDGDVDVRTDDRILCQGNIFEVTNVFAPTSEMPVKTVYLVLAI